MLYECRQEGVIDQENFATFVLYTLRCKYIEISNLSENLSVILCLLPLFHLADKFNYIFDFSYERELCLFKFGHSNVFAN